MILKNRFKAKKALLLICSPLYIIFLQGCTDNLNNNNTGFFDSGSCPIESVPALTDKSLCISINDCPFQFCSAGSGGDFEVIIGHRDGGVNQLQCNRRLVNLSLHSCSFGVGSSNKAKIKSLEVVREDDGTNRIHLSMAKGAIIEPEKEDDGEGDDNNDNNNDTGNKNDKGLRLVSFYSLRCGGYINQNSLLTSGSLYKARLDKDKGSMIISDSNIICGKVEEGASEATLECTYNANSGCIFTLSLWGYDSRNNFSNRKTIEIR